MDDFATPESNAQNRITIEMIVGPILPLMDAMAEECPEIGFAESLAAASYLRLNLWSLHPELFSDMPVSAQHWLPNDRGPAPPSELIVERSLRDVLPYVCCDAHFGIPDANPKLKCDECRAIAVPRVAQTHVAIELELARAEGERRRPGLPALLYLQAIVEPHTTRSLPDDAGLRYLIRRHIRGSILGDDAEAELAAYLRAAASAIVESPLLSDEAQRIAKTLRDRTSRPLTPDDVRSVHSGSLLASPPTERLASIRFHAGETTVRIDRDAGLGLRAVRDQLARQGLIPSHKRKAKEVAAERVVEIPDESGRTLMASIEIREEIERVRAHFEAVTDHAALAAIAWKLEGLTQAEAAVRHGVSVDAIARGFARVRNRFESLDPPA